MSKPILGIIGGGQLGSMLATAAKKLNIRTVIFCDDLNAPAQKFADEFVYGKYNDQNKIDEFIKKVDIITYEFENIPFETLNKINKIKPVLPKPSINRIIQHRLAEKDFINKLNIKTTQYVSILSKSEINSVENLLPGLLKTTTLGYDGKGQYKIESIKNLDSLDIDFSKEYILEKVVRL
jgi:5-(carboxyamino)imidazole ribonucleotide synthase